MTVKELINELLNYDLSDDVFVGLDNSCNNDDTVISIRGLEEVGRNTKVVFLPKHDLKLNLD